MPKHVLPEVEKYMKQSKKRRTWTKIVSVMACLVVFCTTYALILPAITQENKVTCTLAEHKHDENCYTTTVTENLICTKPEVVYHEHTDECYEIVEIAAQAAAVQVSDSAAETASDEETADVTETIADGQGEESGVSEDSEAVEESSAIETEEPGDETSTEMTIEKVLICTMPEKEVHEHTETCYEKIESEPTLSCELQEHTHGLACYADLTADVETAEVWEKTFADVELKGVWAEDVIAIAKTQLGYVESSKNYIVESKKEADGTIEETAKGYTRYGAWYGDAYGDWCAMFASFCLDYAGVEGMPLEAYCPTWIEKLSAEDVNLYHTTGAYIPEAGNLVFFDWDADGESDHVGIVTAVNSNTEDGVMEIETIEGNSNNRVAAQTYPMTDETIMGFAALPYQLSEEEQIEVDRVIAMIDEMPSVDEIEEQLLAYEEAEDMDAYEAYYKSVGTQGQRAYQAYTALSEKLQAHVTNIDRLMESSWLWSMVTLGSTVTVPVHQVNSHTIDGADPNIGYTTLLRGKSPKKFGIDFKFEYWTSIIVEEDENGELYVGQILRVKKDFDKGPCGPVTPNGFVLLVWVSDMSESALTMSVGDRVEVSFDYTQTYEREAVGSSAKSHGTVTFSPRNLTSNNTSTVEGVHTSDFVELNIYDYYGADTAAAAGKTNINTLWNGDKKYPGFQWNGGAYMTSSNFSLFRVDNIDFGNSMIKDFNYGSTDNSITNGVSSNYQKVGNQDGLINDIVEYPTGFWANLPTGISNNVNVLRPTLLEGYPALVDDTSLKYLFTENEYAAKKNTVSIDGLFQQDPVSGEYWFDSRDNHAYYSNDKFTLYNQIITPNFILYPFGNFLPFDSITDPNKVTRVTDIDHVSGSADNTVTGYMQMIRSRLQEGGMDVTEKQLYDMLGIYQEALKAKNATYPANWKAEDAINYYFQNSSEFKSAFANSGMNFNTTPTLQTLLNRLYNVDFDVKKNFFFGMEMKMNFMQPRRGMTGNDKDNDGQSDYPMKFYFAGDDDVWVYVDNTLFLDLTGIHRHVGGEIDFVNGVVNYYAMDSYIDGAVKSTPYLSIGFEDIVSMDQLQANGTRPDDGRFTVNLNGKSVGGTTAYTFKDYTSHSFNFYYMERGSGSSVCRINFNFPLLRQNTISVSKENVTTEGVAADEVVVGNPDYYFNIMSTTPGKLFVGPNSVTKIKEYKIEDSDGNPVINPKTGTQIFETDGYGIFTLKAGQTAYFEGIKENEGKYYVQELIKEEDNNLYPLVYVNDVESRYNDIITWTERKYFSETSEFDAENPQIGPYSSKWYGRSGQDTDPSTSASYHFEQQNRLDVKKLGKLSITKEVEAYEASRAITYYKMYVTLDGEPLPEGTSYVINDGSSRTVTEAGFIEIAAGETATISNIISGTRFLVQEDTASSAGYTVTYKQTGASEVENDGTCISGVIHIGDSQTSPLVEVTVTNAEHGVSVKIPVTKEFRAGGDDKERTFTFTLKEVTDDTGLTVVDSGTTLTGTITTPTEKSLEFLLSYYSRQFTAGTHRFYYKITETGTSDDALPNDQAFIAEVTVIKNEGSEEISASVKIYPKGESSELAAATFVNTLTGNLKLEKIVEGGTEAQTNESFDFMIELETGDSGVTLKDSYPVTITQADGSARSDSFSVTDGIISVNSVHHGDSIVIHDLPVGTKWTITETRADGYNVKTAVTINAADPVKGTGTVTNGQIVSGNTSVVYTNQQLYELPESGGTGQTLYTMAGLMLVLCSAAFLLYRYQKRRREAN